jgi:hypothetical protein
VSEGAGTPLGRNHVKLMGGLRAGGRTRVEDRVVLVTTLGGCDLDLSEAELTAPKLTIVKVSLLGGVELTVSADARVTVHGLSIGGRKIDPAAGAGDGPEIVVQSYGLIGGVKIRRAR